MPYLGQSPSKGDENNFKILDDISSYTLTFDGSDSSVVSAANDTITSLSHRFVQGQRVTYTDGDGSAIAGLTDATVYFIIKEDHNTIKLATSASNASNGVAVNITNVGSGSSHTLNVAFDGVNTKFKATHTNGQKARITRSAQLVISINGVIQQPHDSATPSTGFGFDLDGTIVFSQAPVVGDVYWAHVLTNNNVTFDISDNDVDNFTGDGSTVSFNLSKTPPDNRNVLVTIDGVVQYPNDPDGTARAYTVVENVLTFTTAPASATEIQVRHIGFAGSTSGGGGGVTNFYGRTGSVTLINTDNIVANNAEFAGNLTVQGTMTTLDTKVTEVDQLEVAANNTTVGVAITQSGTGDILNLYDGSTEVFSVTDGGDVGIARSIFHLGDTNTLIGFPENDNVSFRTGGIERVSITGAGVSIKSGNPALRLQGTSSSFGDTAKIIASRNNDGSLVTGSIVFDPVNAAGADIIFNTRDSNVVGERVRIKNDGKVGIGTNNPDHSLHVFKDGGDSVITIESTGDGNDSALEFFRTSSAGDSKGAGSIYVTGDTSTSVAKMKFGVAQNISHGTYPRMTIEGQYGNVGIGSESPNAKFVVSNEGQNGFEFNPNFNSNNSIIASYNRNSDAYTQFTLSASQHIFSQGGTEYGRFNANGRLGIGTEDPETNLTIAKNATNQTVTTIPTVRLTNLDTTAVATDIVGSYEFFSKDVHSNNKVTGFMRNTPTDAGVNYDLTFGTIKTGDSNAVEKLRITSAGKVGINSTSPTHTLDVVGGYQALGLYRNDFTGNSGAGIELNFGRAKANGDLFNCATVSAVGSDNTGTSGQLRISVLDSGSIDEKLRIDSSGRVSIGDNLSQTAYPFYVAKDLNTGGNLLSFGNTDSTYSQSITLSFDSSKDMKWTGGSGSGGLIWDVGTRGYQFKIGSEEKVRINSTGNVGIATDMSGGGGAYGRLSVVIPSQSGGSALQVMNSAQGSGDGSLTNIILRSVNNLGNQWAGAEYRAQEHIFSNQTTEALRIKGSRLLIGDTANRLVWGINPVLQVNGTEWDDTCIAIHNFGNNTRRPTLLFTKGRSNTLGNFGTPVNAGEGLGIIGWAAHDSTDAENLACYIQGIAESAPSTNNQYGAITFSTVNGGTTAYERLRITKSGNIEISTSTDTNPRYLNFNSNRSNVDDALGGVVGVWNGNSVAAINFKTGATSGKNNGDIQFVTYSGGTAYERFRITSSGSYLFSNSNPPATGAMMHVTDDGSATTMGSASTFRVSNNGSSANYSVFEAESGQAGIRLSNSGRTLIGDHIANPSATLHVIGKNNDGQHAIAQFGKDGEARYARFVSINNQQNFDHLLLTRYDNSTTDILRLQNTYASGTGWGTGIGWYGDGGNVTGRIKVVNATTNSSVARMHLEVNNQSVIHMDHAPNRVMVGQPASAGGFHDQAPLQARSSQSNTGCFTGKSTNYNTAFGILPWHTGGTFLTSGTTYNNGSWTHISDGNDNMLFYMKPNGWRWYSSDSGSTNWNVASDVGLMNSVGQWTGGTSSDRRLKDNIVNMSTSDALTKVTQLQGVSYTWSSEVQKKYGTGVYPEGTHYGFIAQDVKTVWPEAHIITQTDNESDFDDDPTKDVKDDVYYGEIEGVKMEKMVPLLVEAIKELKKENDALKARITTLEG